MPMKSDICKNFELSSLILFLFFQNISEVFVKGLIWLALTDPQEFPPQHLIKKEEQTSYW